MNPRDSWKVKNYLSQKRRHCLPGKTNNKTRRDFSQLRQWALKLASWASCHEFFGALSRQMETKRPKKICPVRAHCRRASAVPSQNSAQKRKMLRYYGEYREINATAPRSQSKFCRGVWKNENPKAVQRRGFCRFFWSSRRQETLNCKPQSP